METSAARDALVGLRVLVADDDPGVRTLYATLLRATDGVAWVIEADDGATAVALGHEHDLDVAVLDLHMPRLDGLEAALRLRGLQPSLQIALQSSDRDLLRQRAADLELPLFDKADFELLLAWVERQAAAGAALVASLAPKRDLYCGLCGYGIVTCAAPERCPMCGEKPAWAELGGATAHAARYERLAG